MAVSYRKLLKALEPYCDKIRYNGRHLVCYPTGLKRTITMSVTPSDIHAYDMAYREFRREGIIIEELRHIR